MIYRLVAWAEGSHRIQVLKGRQGRAGFRNMTLETFCDIVWAEIWDDCPPLGDQAQYRDIMVRLFIDGEEPRNITWKDAQGKTHRLTEPQPGRLGGKPNKATMDEARALHERLKAARAQARELASGDNG